MALNIPYSIFHLARLLYVTLETFGPYYVQRRAMENLVMSFHTGRKARNSLTSLVTGNVSTVERTTCRKEGK